MGKSLEYAFAGFLLGLGIGCLAASYQWQRNCDKYGFYVHYKEIYACEMIGRTDE